MHVLLEILDNLKVHLAVEAERIENFRQQVEQLVQEHQVFLSLD